MEAAEQSYRLSKYAEIVHLGDLTVIAHGPRLQRICLASTLGEPLARRLARDVTPSSFVRDPTLGERGAALFDELVDRGILVPVGEPEDEQLHAELSGRLGTADFLDEGESYNTPVVADGTSYATTELRPLRMQLIGG